MFRSAMGRVKCRQAEMGTGTSGPSRTRAGRDRHGRPARTGRLTDEDLSSWRHGSSERPQRQLPYGLRMGRVRDGSPSPSRPPAAMSAALVVGAVACCSLLRKATTDNHRLGCRLRRPSATPRLAVAHHCATWQAAQRVAGQGVPQVARRDEDFPVSVLRDLSDRAGNHCSIPWCPKTTSGPGRNGGSVNSGTGAHIHSAKPGGPRGNGDLTTEELRAHNNGLWCLPDGVRCRR